MLTLLLRRLGLRHARLAPGQTALLVLILALGVAVFTAVRLANRAAVSSFTHFTDTLTGRSDLIIQAPTGTLPESVLPELRAALADLAVQIHPVVESSAAEPAAPAAPRFGRRSFTLLGVDLIAVANLATQQAAETRFFADSDRSETTEPSRSVSFFDLFADEPLVWLSPAFASSLPPHLDLILNDRPVRLRVAGPIPRAPEAPPAPANLIVLDLPRLQHLVGREGRLDRVEFILEPGPALDTRRATLAQRLEALARPSPAPTQSPGSPLAAASEPNVRNTNIGSEAAPRWLLTDSEKRRETAETMTAAFRLNLTVLSLIALLVGLYLVFQALDGAVVRRRGEIAILRSLGVDARTIRRAWLAEAAALGLAGAALGLLLGWAGAQLAVRAVGQTVNALYFSTSVAAAHLTLPEALLSLAAGVLASVVAGWAPARVAAETPPAQVLVRAAPGAIGGRWLRSWPLALGALLAGLALSRLPPLDLGGGTRFPLAGHLAAFCGILGGGILAALALPALGRVLRPLAERGATWRVALGHIARPTGRHRLAAAALVCAIGMAAGMAILVASFERSVRGWINSALQADLYVSSAGAQSAGSDNKIAPETWRALAAHPAIAHAATFSAYPLTLDGKPTTLAGGDLAHQASRDGFLWIGAPPPPEALDPAKNPGLALASESFAERFRIRSGDTITVPTPSGPQPLRVAALYADYGNERGTLLVDRKHTVRWFADDHASSLALDLVPGANAETVRAELAAAHPGLSILTNATLRAEVLRIFRQTFSITYALEFIGLAVAVGGLALSLASVLLDRRDELTTLRALGFRRSEIARATALEGGALALCATLAGIALSFALGWLLIHVINKQSFGWTLAFAVPVVQLAALAALVVGTGVLVSHLVGRWATSLPADREE
jgi:putative ABC transport system permease protein